MMLESSLVAPCASKRLLTRTDMNWNHHLQCGDTRKTAISASFSPTTLQRRGRGSQTRQQANLAPLGTLCEPVSNHDALQGQRTQASNLTMPCSAGTCPAGGLHKSLVEEENCADWHVARIRCRVAYDRGLGFIVFTNGLSLYASSSLRGPQLKPRVESSALSGSFAQTQVQARTSCHQQGRI